tara:strand:- start:6190 stop:6351 length:162 start_codon:yes stop_codon:yes gene_type:complete
MAFFTVELEQILLEYLIYNIDQYQNFLRIHLLLVELPRLKPLLLIRGKGGKNC